MAQVLSHPLTQVILTGRRCLRCEFVCRLFPNDRMGVPLHRARALPPIILPSSRGNIYPFSSSERPRDGLRGQLFPSFFLCCSLQISVALHDIALSKAFFLYSLLSALQKAFITLLLPSSSAVVGCALLSRLVVVCLSQIFYIHCH